MSPKWSKRFELKPGRWVFVPTRETVQVGRDIKRAVEKRWKAPRYYYHLRSGGHVHALRSHVGNSVFLRLDIQDFFGSLNRSRVTRCLKAKFGYKQAREWANASTVILRETKRSMVPFGFVQSPIIASLCLFSSALGGYLAHLHKGRKFAVSVYVDDIIVSCKDCHGAQLEDEILPTLKAKAERSRFAFSAEKSQGPAHAITAFNIELAHASMHIEENRMEKFMAALQASESQFERSGILGYVASVNEDQHRAVVGATKPPAPHTRTSE